MSNWIFLSKDLGDPYMNQFAHGCGSVPIDSNKFNYDESEDPIVLRGILKKKFIHKCWEDNRDFYYMDTGYFGNERTQSNPNGWKYWHRIVKNNLQHDEIITRPGDRFKNFKKKFQPWKKEGRKILIAAPDEKPMKFYGLNLEEWLESTINEIKKHTDRPIEVRRRNKLRLDRMTVDTLEQALNNDVFALVTYNSNAAVESIFHGIPVFVLAPACAAGPMGKRTLSEIENPFYPEREQLQHWANHLAYGQFHISEIKSGKAKRILEEQ
jgi:hypothetical protein